MPAGVRPAATPAGEEANAAQLVANTADHRDVLSAAAVVAVIVYVPRGGDHHPVGGGIDSWAAFAEAEDGILRRFSSFGARDGPLGDAPLLGNGVRFPVAGFNNHGDTRERVNERVTGVIRDAPGLFDRINRGQLDGIEVFLVVGFNDCEREVMEEGVFTDKSVRAQDLSVACCLSSPARLHPE